MGADKPDSMFILKFAAGSAAGAIGSLAGNPFDVLKTYVPAAAALAAAHDHRHSFAASHTPGAGRIQSHQYTLTSPHVYNDMRGPNQMWLSTYPQAHSKPRNYPRPNPRPHRESRPRPHPHPQLDSILRPQAYTHPNSRLHAHPHFHRLFLPSPANLIPQLQSDDDGRAGEASDLPRGRGRHVPKPGARQRTAVGTCASPCPLRHADFSSFQLRPTHKDAPLTMITLEFLFFHFYFSIFNK